MHQHLPHSILPYTSYMAQQTLLKMMSNSIPSHIPGYWSLCIYCQHNYFCLTFILIELYLVLHWNIPIFLADNSLPYQEIRKRFDFQAVLNGTYSVDSFILLRYIHIVCFHTCFISQEQDIWEIFENRQLPLAIMYSQISLRCGCHHHCWQPHIMVK